ncbi:MAG TPA: hypothetical protein VK117_06405, partial [Pyrinomonadaceae bacterium]|nr:hypothetical protein [Pyrinomonadaceae bacterium]
MKIGTLTVRLAPGPSISIAPEIFSPFGARAQSIDDRLAQQRRRRPEHGRLAVQVTGAARSIKIIF